MNIHLLKRTAIAFLPACLLVSCYVTSAAPNSKRAKAGQKAGQKAPQETAKSSKEKARANQRADNRNTSNTKASRNKKHDETGQETKRARKQREATLRRAEEKRRAEAARLAAIARQRARDEELRDHVQSLIAKDDLTGEDAEVRRVAVNALGKHAGTVVVMNPQTGRVYSIVNQQWAVREGFKPCSTIKLVTSVAGLNEDVIDPNNTTRISDSNQVSLTRALAYSSNHYFQIVGEQVGFDKMVAYARRLGLGEKTGINARNEFEGRVPGSGSFNAINRMSSHGDHYEVTALQLATLVSAIGNGGKLVTPYVVRSQRDELKQKTKVRRRVSVDADVWNQVIPGMIGSVNYGSGKRAQDPQQQVAGKTGTCIENGSWVGLFTSYAPVSNPRLAVVVITRGPDARGHLPAAVAGRIYRELGDRSGTPVFNVASSRGRKPAETVDEEETAIADEPEFKVEPSTVFRGESGSPSKVRPVLMSIPEPHDVVRPAKGDAAGDGGQTRPRRVLGE